MRLRAIPAMVAGIVVLACTSDGPVPTAPDEAVTTNGAAASAQIAPERYIVVYNSSVNDTRREISSGVTPAEAHIDYVYQHALRGWAGELSPRERERLRGDTNIAFIERDASFTVTGIQTPVPSWGLDRIDQRGLPLNTTYSYPGNGAGVHFYSIDSGLLYSHSEFGGRAFPGYDAITPGGGAVDCIGHGTHTASTAAGSTVGVAKGMTIIGVRILDCGGVGTSSEVIAGVDWVTQNAIKPAVANMSVGSVHAYAIDLAVSNSIASGVVYTISAGNGSHDACLDSPGSTPAAITVAASTIDDAQAGLSNFGSCVDIYAPGIGIYGAWFGSNTSYQTLNGTSMAAPHVAGVVGQYLSVHPTATPAQVAAAIVGNATMNALSNVTPGTPNALLYSGFLAPNLAPSATISSPANGSSFVEQSSVAFAGGGTDPEQGTLSGVSLQWTSSRDGVIGNGASFSTSALSVGTHTITLTASDAQGATGNASRTITITANRPPVSTIVAPLNGANAIENSVVAFAGTGIDPEQGALSGASMQWASDLDGSIGTGLSFTKNNLSVGTHTIRLVTTDARGLADTATATLIIAPLNPPPVARYSVNCTLLVCMFDASASTDNTGVVSYRWDYGAGFNPETRTGPTARNTYSVNGTYTVTLTVSDAGGATNTIQKVLVVGTPANQPPVSYITSPSNGAAFTQGVNVSFAGTANDPQQGALGGSSMVWTSSRDGVIGTGTSFATSSLTVGTHTITLTATDAGGLTGVASRTITVTAANQAPSATISTPANSASFVQGASVSFSGSGSDPEQGTLTGSSLVWTSNLAGTIGSGMSFSTSSLSVGTHTITLTVTDAQGLTSTATRSITIVANQAPTASITAPANGIVAMVGTPLMFSGAASDPEQGALGGASLTWTSNRDGVIGTGTSFTTSTLTAGTHTITLTATDAQGATGTATRTISLFVNQPPAVTIASPANGTSVMLGTVVSFSGSANDPEQGALTGASLAWTSNRDGAIGTGPTFSTASLTVGTHTITLTATDAFGATGTATRSITIFANQAPSASITAPTNGATLMLGASVSFAGTGTDPEQGTLGNSSLTWTSNRDGVIGTGTSFSRSNLTAGVHTITLTAADAQGLTGTATRSITIAVNQAPTAAISSPMASAAFVQGVAVTFTGNGTDPEQGTLGGASLAWTSSRDGAIGTGATFSKSNLTVGVHTITLTATDAQGLTGVATRSITITQPNAPPVAAFTYVCTGLVCMFNSSTSTDDAGVVNYRWDYGAGFNPENRNTTTARNTYSVPGFYVVKLTVYDAAGLTNTIQKLLVVGNPPNTPPVATITLPATNGTSVTQGNSVSFAGTGIDPQEGALSGASLTWTSNLDGTIGTGTAFSTNILSVGTHTITLMARDAVNATGSTTRTIIVSPLNAPPLPRFTANCSTPNARECLFDASTSTDDVGIVSYRWDWGNGMSETRTSPPARNVYAAPGTYTVTLTVTDTGGIARSFSLVVVAQ